MVEAHAFAFRLKHRVWPNLLFVVALLYAAWFTVVLYAAQQAWGDDPVRWGGGVHTFTWAIVGVLFFALVLVYFVLLLVRREIPARTYTIGHTTHDPRPGAPETVTAETDPPYGRA